MARFDRAIPPGGEGKITLEVRTKGQRGKFHKTGHVLSNDPNNPKVSIALKGTIWLPIDMKPRAALLNGIVGEPIETVVHLRAEKEDPLILQLDSVSIPEKVSAELREVEKGRRYELKLKNRVQEDGAFAGEVRIKTNYPEQPEVRVPIYGGIRAMVQITPKSLSFGRMTEERLESLKRTGGSMSRPVMVVLNRGDDLKIDKMGFEKSLFKVVTRPIQPGRRIQLLVEPILDKLTKGLNEDRLRIYTNQTERETVVDIRFEVL